MAEPSSNMSLTYTGEGLNVIRARCTKFAYGFKVIHQESHARTHRGMYPHQRAIGTFMIEVQFLNYAEYRQFMVFMTGYIQAWLHPPSAKPFYTPGVTVVLATENIREVRIGVPIQGVTDGDHVGNIGYPSQIVFQTIRDPLDTEVATENSDTERLSYAEFGNDKGAEDDAAKFFYPFSAGSTDINIKPTDIYGVATGGVISPKNPTGAPPSNPTPLGGPGSNVPAPPTGPGMGG